MKCITHKCENHFWEGGGVYIAAPTLGTQSYSMQFICQPCWTAITNPDSSSVHSQIARNFRQVETNEKALSMMRLPK
jgi:hypothetical protein